jgi:hypothetical protein
MNSVNPCNCNTCETCNTCNHILSHKLATFDFAWFWPPCATPGPAPCSKPSQNHPPSTVCPRPPSGFRSHVSRFTFHLSRLTFHLPHPCYPCHPWLKTFGLVATIATSCN